MKHELFKISDSTLFVYKSLKPLNGETTTTGTDPTTTVMTMTVSGLHHSNKQK